MPKDGCVSGRHHFPPQIHDRLHDVSGGNTVLAAKIQDKFGIEFLALFALSITSPATR
jgi:hypothetical protein